MELVWMLSKSIQVERRWFEVSVYNVAKHKTRIEKLEQKVLLLMYKCTQIPDLEKQPAAKNAKTAMEKEFVSDLTSP